MFDCTARDLVDSVVMEHADALIFAYGQTGSGKTFSMAGAAGLRTLRNASSDPGVYQLCAVRLFAKLRELKETRSVVVSFVEIYGPKVRDLLDGRREVKLLEDAKGHTQCLGVNEVPVDSADEFCALVADGLSLRVSKKMTQNSDSSRSHAVLCVQLFTEQDQVRKPCGRFQLIDLAGNERGADNAAACAQQRQESAEINKSLLALKECIRTLARGRQEDHAPFRQSKLTLLLRDSFMSPKTRVCMLACIGPSHVHSEYTLNTLRYAAMLKDL